MMGRVDWRHGPRHGNNREKEAPEMADARVRLCAVGRQSHLGVSRLQSQTGPGRLRVHGLALRDCRGHLRSVRVPEPRLALERTAASGGEAELLALRSGYLHRALRQ